MWQSVLRIVFALLITAVGASLLIGTVSAEDPVPEQPPGSNRVASDLYSLGTEVSVTVTYHDSSRPPQTQTWSLAPGASTSGVQAGINSLLASAESGCSTAKVTEKVGGFGGHGSAKLYSQTWWCWDSRIITNDPKLSAWGKSSPTIRFKGITYRVVERGGKGQNYADDRVKGKFCGLYCGIVWITKTVNANGRLVTWDSGYE